MLRYAMLCHAMPTCQTTSERCGGAQANAGHWGRARCNVGVAPNPFIRPSHWGPLALVPLVFVRNIPQNSAKILQQSRKHSAKIRKQSANFRKIPQNPQNSAKLLQKSAKSKNTKGTTC